MPTNGEALRTAFESRELDRLMALFDERVVWRGILADHEHPPGGDHDHQAPLCTDRQEVREVFERFLEAGGTGDPVIVSEAGHSVLVDPRPEPAPPVKLHQIFTFRGGRVVLIQDYPDRTSAMADLFVSA